MRIIGGEFGGRRFNPPANIPARPTTELAKEGIFNMLSNMIDFEGIATLDLFGGTGSITYELASRGATQLTVVEKDDKSVSFIKKTIEQLHIADRVRPIRSDVFKYLKQCTGQFDLVFADPPYALPNIDEIPMLVFSMELLKPGGLFIMEHSARNNYQEHPNFQRLKNYGTSLFTIFAQPTQ